METMSLWLTGKVVPCPRPRVSSYRPPYYPPAYDRWRQGARLEAASQYDGDPMTGDIGMNLAIYGASSQADLSNLAKSVEDALEGVCYFNDNQICHLAVQRWSAACSHDGQPGCDVSIWQIEGDDRRG